MQEEKSAPEKRIDMWLAKVRKGLFALNKEKFLQIKREGCLMIYSVIVRHWGYEVVTVFITRAQVQRDGMCQQQFKEGVASMKDARSLV